jgi:CheY-like chemotaxis protein
MSSYNQQRLLVVDDEVDFAEFVSDLAVRNGFLVATANNGLDARSRYSEFLPDIIVLDIVMPQSDGIEFIEWLGSQGATARLIVITGYNPSYAKLAERLAEARGLSSVSVLTKPVRMATLLMALRGDSSAS